MFKTQGRMAHISQHIFYNYIDRRTDINYMLFRRIIKILYK